MYPLAAQTGMQMVGDWDCHYAEATRISADGQAIVGWGLRCSPNITEIAFRWSEGTGLQGLVPFSTSANAFGVSADGSVVVGIAYDADRFSFAFRRNATHGVQVLLDRNQARDPSAVAVSADGSSWSVNMSAFLLPIIACFGGIRKTEFRIWVNADGSRLERAYAVSEDGRYIVGQGVNATARRYEGFVLDTWRTGDTNGDGCIDDSDLLAVLFAFETRGTGHTRHEDINKDGTVADRDLLSVLLHFGEGC